MATPPALEGTFNQQPAQLADPVPNALAQPNNPFDQALGAPAELAAPAEGGAEAPAQIDPFTQALAPTEELPLEEGQTPGFLAQNFTPEGLRQQAETFRARVAASFGRTPGEREDALKDFLGEANVRKDGDNFLVKLGGKKKFQKLDPASFELVNDLFADFFREHLEGAFGTAGGIAGVAAQGPLAVEPVSTAAGVAAGFGAGVALGSTVADAIAENALGISRDPSRGGVAQPGTVIGGEFGAQLEAGGERLGEKLTEGALAASFTKLASGLTAKIASRRDTIKQLRALKDTPKGEVLKESIEQNLQTMDHLKELDAVVNLPGSDIPVLAHQLAPHTEASKIAKSLSGSAEFQKAQLLGAKNFDDTIVTMVEESADLLPGSLRTTLKEGVKGEGRAGMQQEVVGMLKKVRAAEGKVIEEFRMKAGNVAKTTPLPAPKTVAALDEALTSMGAQVGPGGRIQFPEVNELAGILGTDSKPFIGFIKQDLQRLADKVAASQGTGVPIDDLIKESARIGSKNPTASRVGGRFKQIVGQMSSALREDTRDGMGLILSETDKAAYDAAIGKFRQAATGQQVLRNMLKQDDMATNTFVKGIISKGRTGLEQFKAAKEFILQEDPELWRKVNSEFFEELFLKHRNVDPNAPLSFNSKAVRKELSGYGPEMLKELMPGGVKPASVFKALDLSEQLEKTLISGSDTEVEKLGKSLIGASSSFISAKLNAGHALLKFGRADARLLKLMNRKGVDVFLEKVPEAERAGWRSMIDLAITSAKNKGIIDTVRQAGIAPATASAADSATQLGQQFLNRLQPGQPQ